MTTKAILLTLLFGASACGGDDGGESCNVGSEGCACTSGDACNAGLTCADGVCLDSGTDADVDTDADSDADSDTDTGSDTETSTDTGSPGTTCLQYCIGVVGSCVEPFDQYPEGAPQQVCESFCALLDPGDPDDPTGDTLECRAANVPGLEDDFSTMCPIAGPYGAGVCGESQCDVFCRIMQTVCTDANQQYADEAACLADCNALPDADEPFVFDGSDRGATLRCRGHRLAVATLADAALHCPAAAGVTFCNDAY